MQRFTWMSLFVLLLSACEKPSVDEESVKAIVETERSTDAAMISKGSEIYQAHCAQCHGKNGEGDPNWRKRNADDSFPPPPLNGSGHAWHHPKAWLREKIKTGKPLGNMPAWGGKLTDSDIESVIAWFQAQWSDPVYEAWRKNQLRAVQNK